MPSSGTCRHAYGKRWNIYLTDKPHFSAWFQSHDIDPYPSYGSAFGPFSISKKLEGTPLYYATLCGFYDLAAHLLDEHPQHIDARGGYYVTPLVGALAGDHFQIAQLLHQHGADVDVHGENNKTPLISASAHGHPESVQWLIGHGADVNSQDRIGGTPLHWASTNVERPTWLGYYSSTMQIPMLWIIRAILHYALHRPMVTSIWSDYYLSFKLAWI